MSASFDVDPSSSPLGGPAAPVLCCLYDGSIYTPLGNVVCERIDVVEGATPPVARFRYLLDVIAEAEGYPTQFEDLWGPDAHGKGVVKPDDRIVVLTYNPFDERIVLFDGFAQTPQVDVQESVQQVTFQAVGVAARCFDQPIADRVQRDSDDPTSTESGVSVWVDLPVRFNPGGIPNRTPDGADEGADEPATAAPVFLDERMVKSPDPRKYWTLGDAVRYILRAYNDEDWIANPDFAGLVELLESRKPHSDGAYDPDDSSTYDAEPIVVRDFDASNMPWPEALAGLLSLHGFGFRWTLETEDGAPKNGLAVYRLDAADPNAAKPVDLDKAGNPLDPARNNAWRFTLSRDSNAIVNAFELDVPPRRVEASFVLALGFIPLDGDEASGTRQSYLLSNLALPGTNAEAREAYRLYVADEDGSGHWNLTTEAWVEGEPLDLSELFPFDEGSEDVTYVVRRRPGTSTLFSVDDAGNPRKVQLALSRDYAGACPAVWDGTGKWQPIRSGWKLLDDRLGIIVSCEDPEAWGIGEYSGDDPQEPSKTLRGITSQCNPAAPNTRFYLRLTTVIESDRSPVWSAAKRAASPTTFERRRRVDAQDHFRQDTVSKWSAFAAEGDAGSTDVDARDDTGEALALASQLRAAHETAPLIGTIMIPGLSTAFDVGDRISQIRGRDVDLRRNAAAGEGEAPTYPRVVALSWTFADGQATAVSFTDRPGRDPEV
ncbi:hypothetical protein [Paludisphaera rhizosphaerae]|uniref:hypothetical protein n=1 Tax=Paludisphaera rhizosphaerae TaxID=2711216 RepID=UPI0013EDA991|nr:hypothetical protein [Paludisphaera rhizosphaerae]